MPLALGNNYVMFDLLFTPFLEFYLLKFTPFQRFYLLNFAPFQGFLLWQQWQQLSFYLIKPLHIFGLYRVNGRSIKV